MVDSSTTPPVAKQDPIVHTHHGISRTDPYHWMREKESPDVLAYLEAENAYAEAMSAHLKDARTRLYDEIIGRIQQTDLSVPYQIGNYLYYARTETGKQYPIYCRKSVGSEHEQVVIDANIMGEGQTFFALGTMKVSDCGRYLAYSVDTTGFRDYMLSIRDLDTNIDICHLGKARSAVWAADNKTLFLVTEDATKRPDTVWRTTIHNPAERIAIFNEPDALFTVFVRRTRDLEYIIFGSASSATTELQTIPALDPESAPTIVIPRENNHEYDLDHRDGLFYICTNKHAPSFRVVAAPVSDPREENWTEILPSDATIMRESVDCFGGYVAISERSGGRPQVRIINFATGSDSLVQFPEPTFHVRIDQNHVFDTPNLRIAYSSLVTPNSIYDVDLESLTLTLLKQTAVLGGFNSTNYTSDFVYATSPDGAQVPISIVRHKATLIDGTAPCLLYGYGSYGISSAATFQSNQISLLDRGFVFAIAHIRGGGDLGKPWHDAGKLAQKQNTFTDFIAVAEFLKNSLYVHPDRLAIRGGSAGGLLLGAVINQRPDICKLAMNYVPFVDVMNTMLDDTLPLTVGEYLEWGNPNIEADYKTMLAYSPYDNIEAKNYPSMLVRTSLNDSQVMYWEPAKYVARLRACKTDRRPLLFVTDLVSGHGGASGRYDAIREAASDYAWLCDQLNVSI